MTNDIVSRDSSMASGTLLNDNEGTIILGLPGTDYQIYLQTDADLGTQLNKRITGTIHARARRVDLVHTGGRYFEPVYGRPRRLQGRISSLDEATNTITVDCGCPFVCELATGQQAANFSEGMLVSFDVERGATFNPQSVSE